MDNLQKKQNQDVNNDKNTDTDNENIKVSSKSPFLKPKKYASNSQIQPSSSHIHSQIFKEFRNKLYTPVSYNQEEIIKLLNEHE